MDGTNGHFGGGGVADRKSNQNSDRLRITSAVGPRIGNAHGLVLNAIKMGIHSRVKAIFFPGGGRNSIRVWWRSGAVVPSSWRRGGG